LASSDGLFRLFSLRQDFPDAFALLTHQPQGSQSVTITLGPQHFPYVVSSLALAGSGATVYLEPTGPTPVDTSALHLRLNASSAPKWSPVPNTSLGSAPVAMSGPLTASWSLSVPTGKVDPAEVADLLLLVRYTAS